MEKKKRRFIYVFLTTGETKKKLIPVSFTDLDITRFLDSLYKDEGWSGCSSKKEII